VWRPLFRGLRVAQAAAGDKAARSAVASGKNAPKNTECKTAQLHHFSLIRNHYLLKLNCRHILRIFVQYKNFLGGFYA
jgi:hypothetical protein